MADTERITLRMPKPIHDWLRQQAFETRESINSLIIQALEEKMNQPNEAKENKMSYMRSCEYVESNDAYKKAESLSDLPEKEFYKAVKGKALQVPFQMEKHNIGTIGRNGRWERWTNGQDPIWNTYHGYVTWKGTAEELLAEVA